jgi:hypothetical protein
LAIKVVDLDGQFLNAIDAGQRCRKKILGNLLYHAFGKSIRTTGG